MMVLLMVLYYIVFGSVAINGIYVAVIGFTLTFGTSVFGLLKMGVGTIDQGQYEAAYALGYSNRVFYMDEGGIYEDGSDLQNRLRLVIKNA